MRLHRFYVLQPLGEEVVIDDVSLVNQWTKVFRYQLSNFVILFNGNGYDYTYTIDTIDKKMCSLTCTKKDVSYIPFTKITLCLSIIKKDNFELAVQKATELGVTTIIPILSSRSEKKNLSFDRLEKIAIESAEQCGRGDVPHIMPIVTLEQALAKVHDKQLLIMLDLGTKSLVNEKQALLDSKNISEITLFIGPEGGWSDEDHELMNNRGVKKYSLGNTVLRAETAAIVAVSLFTL